jgi:hypothetical protein
MEVYQNVIEVDVQYVMFLGFFLKIDYHLMMNEVMEVEQMIFFLVCRHYRMFLVVVIVVLMVVQLL